MTPAIEMQTFMHFDRRVWEDRSLDAMAKRVIAALAFVLILGASIPVITTVSGQYDQPKTQLEYEVRDLREKVEKLADVNTQIALLVAHQKLEDERFNSDQQFKLLIGSGFGLAILGWFLQQLGVTFGAGRKNDAR